MILPLPISNCSLTKSRFGEASGIFLISSSLNAYEKATVLSVTLLKLARPITLPYTDLEGRIIQLWKYKNSLIASLRTMTTFSILSGSRVYNALQPQENNTALLERLEQAGLREWHFGYKQDTGEIAVWPFLIAAGRFGDKRSRFQQNIDGQKGHLQRSDLKAAWREDSRGEVVARRSDGIPYDHITEVRNAQRGLKNTINDIRRQLQRNDHPPETRARLQKELSQASRLLDHSEGYIKSPVMKSPASRNFSQILQQTRLTDSYRASNPQNPISAKGGTGGEIGGVACSTSYIEGLFASPESMFEEEHFFFLPKVGEEDRLPFSNQELQQILRELAVGIYVHSAVPFFSLHFNQESDLFPVIHPYYENTLVGRVIGMLDYIMKGYLNGGIFEEDFIDAWYRDSNWDKKSESALTKLIDFRQYCEEKLKGDDKQYRSLRDLQRFNELTGLGTLDEKLEKAAEMVGVLQEVEPEELKHFHGFSNSFRIIAKQNSVRKEGTVFSIDADFDVLYTINPSPQYQAALEIYQRKYGRFPPSYRKMLGVYKIMCTRIHDHMVKMPLCREYFSMLSVMNFFSGYFSTLKKHRIIPTLAPMEIEIPKGCPPLFPHLPITNLVKETIKYNPVSHMKKVLQSNSVLIERYLLDQFEGFKGYTLMTPNYYDASTKDQLLKVWTATFNDCVAELSSSHLRRYLIKSNFKDIQSEPLELLGQIARTFLQSLRNSDPSIKQASGKGVVAWFLKTYQADPDLNKTIEIATLPLSIPRVKNELSSDEIEAGKRIVGGCGIKLEKYTISPSPESTAILQNNFSFLKALKPESWEMISSDETHSSRGAIFRLMLEDVPVWLNEDYSWMESLLVVPHGRNALHEAVLAEDVSGVTSELEKGASCLAEDAHGYLPIHYAAMQGNLELLEILLQREPKTLNAISHSRATPLMVAIQSHQTKAVRFLMDRKPQMISLAGGYTPLHAALHEGHLDVIETLLDYPPLIFSCLNELAEEGGTPLILACELDSPLIVQRLMKLGADPRIARKNGITPIEISILRNCASVLECLLPHATPSEHAIATASQEGSVKILELLVQTPVFYAYRDGYQDTALHVAVRNGHVSESLVIIRNCQDRSYLNQRNEGNETPLNLAASLGLWEIIHELHQKKIEIHVPPLLRTEYHSVLKDIFDQRSFTTAELQHYLEIAVEAGNYMAITQVLEPRGVKLENFKNSKGWGLLHCLAKSDGIFLFRRLMMKANDFLLPLSMEGNKTLPYLAAEHGSGRVLKFLLENIKKNQLALHQFYHRHPLYAAIESRSVANTALMLELFSHEKLENIQLDKEGTRPVHLAARLGLKAILKLLIAKGADLSVKDAKGCISLDYAVQAKAIEIVKFLLKKEGVSITPTALLWAVTQNDPITLQLIFQAHPSQDTLNQALIMAIENHDSASFSVLLKQGASLDALTKEGLTPLLLASQNGEFEVLKEILKKPPGNQKDGKGNGSLHLACMGGHTHCVHLLLQAGYKDEKNKEGKTALELAKFHRAIRTLLQGEKNGPNQHLDALVEAVQKEDSNAVHTLLVKLNPTEVLFIEKDQSWGTPLQLLLQMGNKTIIQYVIKEFFLHSEIRDRAGNTWAHRIIEIGLSPLNVVKIDLTTPNHKGEAPLHYAARIATPEFLGALLDRLTPSCSEPVDKKGQTPIFHAIQCENEKNIEILMRKGANLRHYDHDLLTPLLKACKEQNLAVARLLLKNGADPNQAGTLDGFTPLHFACIQKNHEIFLALLASGARYNTKTDEGMNLVHLAAAHGNHRLLRFLAAKGMSFKTKDNRGFQPIHAAASLGKTDTLKMIASLDPETPHLPLELEKNNTFDKEDKKMSTFLNGVTPLHLAAGMGTPETVKMLLDLRAEPEAKTTAGASVFSFAARNTAAPPILDQFYAYKFTQRLHELSPAIMGAIAEDNLDAVISLYKQGVPINAELNGGFPGLHLACQSRALQCTQWFLQNGADPFFRCVTGRNAFEIAASEGSYEQFSFLLEYAQPNLDQLNNRGETLMHLAATAGQLQHVILLILYGASIDITDIQERSPLYLAVKGNHLGVAKVLLACGAHIHTQNLQGKSALDLVSDMQSPLQKCLVEFEAILKNSRPNESRLHRAVKFQDPLSVKLLTHLEKVNQQDCDGITALHLAVKMAQTPLVLSLLDNGAEVNIADNEGRSPLWYAAVGSQNQIVMKILMQAGADPLAKDHSELTITEQVKKKKS